MKEELGGSKLGDFEGVEILVGSHGFEVGEFLEVLVVGDEGGVWGELGGDEAVGELDFGLFVKLEG